MQTRRVRIGCTFTYVAEIDTPVVFHVQPRDAPDIALSGGRLAAEPGMALRDYTDLYGNPCIRAILPSGRSRFSYGAVATVPDATEDADEDAAENPPDKLPDDTLIYTLPSRFCLPDLLGRRSVVPVRHAAARLPPGPGDLRLRKRPPHVRLTAARRRPPRSTDVFASGRGVCRDFTHLAISFCRALNIPARYVFGYLPDVDVPPDPAPMDFAAWMEVWLGERWWTFDPRNNRRRKGRIVIGRGRDASDVAMATTFGGPLLTEMLVTAEEAR